MIKCLLSICLVISIAAHTQSATSNKTEKTENYINEISRIIKNNSLFKDSINWEKLSEDTNNLTLLTNDSLNRVLIFQFFTNILRKAGDVHSFFLAKRAISYARERTEIPAPKGCYLGNNIGLIKVPYCFNLDNAKDKDFANTIKSEIKKIDTNYTINGWIVDLRQNVGGNMWPMLAGLNALLYDGTVGYFVSPSQKKTPWISKSGRLNFPMRKIDDYKIKNLNANIAILIDSLTGSSGEMAAISFIGLSNVKVFGQPSAGLTTGNKSFRLSDGNELVLAVTCVADRVQKKYYGKIIPDVIIDVQNSAHDKAIDIAKKWLLEIEHR